MLWSAFAALAVIFMLPPAALRAAETGPLVLTGPADMAALASHMEYIIDPAWQLTIDDFKGLNPVETQALPGNVPDFGYTAARIWLRLPVVNASAGQADWRFFVHANFTQAIAVSQINAQGTVRSLLDLTTDSPFNDRPVDHPQMIAPFQLAPGESATLVISYFSQGSSRLAMSVETPESLAVITSLAEAKSYAFYGMMLVMIALALAALLVLRQAVFAAYAGYLGAMLMYVAHADGAAFQYVWSGFPQFNSMASVVAGSLVLVFGGLFAITFLQTRQFHPLMHRVLIGAVGIVIATTLILWSTDPQLLKRLLVVMISMCALTYLVAGINAARSRFREVRFYVLAWFAGFIPAALFTARHAFGFELSFIQLYDAVRLALVFDAMMMGLAIFDRFNFLRRSALEEALAQTRRNLALSQRLAALESDFSEASATARKREESVKDTVHDLRQPMQALRLSLRQMIDPQTGAAADAGQIESALGYMEKLVADRLAQSADSETSSAETLKINGGAGGRDDPGLHETLRGVTDMFKAEASAKGLELHLRLAAQDGPVEAYALMRVMANLVSNAIKYTAQGRIVVALRRDGTGHRIEVHDTGPGLAGTSFEAALQRHARLERDRAAADGSGLGLSVVRDIVDESGWKVSACAGRRTGASIRITIPAQSRQAAGA
jgi:two-component system, sensor histidine kinase LadS